MSFVLIGQSMPTFWSGILLILLFAVHARRDCRPPASTACAR